MIYDIEQTNKHQYKAGAPYVGFYLYQLEMPTTNMWKTQFFGDVVTWEYRFSCIQWWLRKKNAMWCWGNNIILSNFDCLFEEDPTANISIYHGLWRFSRQPFFLRLFAHIYGIDWSTKKNMDTDTMVVIYHYCVIIYVYTYIYIYNLHILSISI